MITKHNYSAKYDQSKTNGIYCVQFLFFKNDIIGNKILMDWRKNVWHGATIEWKKTNLETRNT